MELALLFGLGEAAAGTVIGASGIGLGGTTTVAAAGGLGGLGGLATAMGIGGTLLSAVGAYQQGQAASAASEYNAKIADIQARTAEGQAADKAGEIARRGKIKTDNIAAAALESGFSLSGSFKDILNQTALMTELDEESALYEGRVRALGFRAGGAQNLADAANYNTASYVGAGAKLMSGFSDLYRTRGSAARSDFSFAS